MNRQVIGKPGDPYITRWVLFRWRGWMLCLHKIHRSDAERELHDHVGDNVSLILWGSYFEVTDHDWGTARIGYHRFPLIPIFRRAETPHRLVLDKPVWTLWLRGPIRRQWGFYHREGWKRA